jgi:RecB family exonuclease
MYSNLVPPAELRRQIDPPDHRLILKYILDRNIEELDARGVAVSSGVRRRGFIDVLSAAVRELLLEGVPPDMLLSEGTDGSMLSAGLTGPAGSAGPGSRDGSNGPEGSARHEVSITSAELLYRLYSGYLMYLDENGLADNSQIPSLLADYIYLSRHSFENTEPVLCWVGFLSLTGSQLRLVKILRELGRRMEFYVPDAGIEDFHDLSKQLDIPKEPIDGDGRGAVRPVRTKDIYGQYEGAAREIARVMTSSASVEGGPLYDIGILVPRERLPLMASALEMCGIPYQSRSETPVSDTRIIETARLAWEAYSLGWPARRTLNLLKNAFVGTSADAWAMPDSEKSAGDENLAPFFNGSASASIPPDGLEAWREALAESRGALALLEGLNSFCEFLDDRQGHSPSEILRALLSLGSEKWEKRLALEIGDETSLDFALREFSSSRLEIRQKLELIEELTPSIGPAGECRFTGDDAVGFLTDWSREAATALSQPLRGAVALYDSPPPVLVSHRIWLMTDVDPSHFPGVSSDHPLLGGAVREGVNREGGDAVHLPTMREKREQSEALFRRLVALGEDVTLLVRSTLDSQGREQGESQFFASLLADPASGADLSDEIYCEFAPSFAGEQISRGVFPRTGRLVGLRGCGGASGVSGLPTKLRVAPSSIDELIDCPFSYWCGHIARFEPPPGPLAAPGAFDRMFQGNLAHEIWRMLWGVYLEGGCSATLATTLAMEWDGALARLEEKYHELGDPRSLAALADLRGAMSKAAAAQDDVEARAREAGFVREGTEFERDLPVIELENVIFAGKADRIDVWMDIGVVIMDYKLGRSARYKDSLQLASYAAMLDAAGERVAGFGYVGHGDGQIRGSWAPEVSAIYKGNSRTRDAEVGEKISAVRDAMGKIDSMSGSGLFPANYASLSCAACQWGTICRRDEMYRAAEPMDEDDDDEIL